MDEDEIARRRFPAAAAQDDHIGRFDAAYVGHAAEAGYRERGSSGGMASWVAGELFRRGKAEGVAPVTRGDPPHEGGGLRYPLALVHPALWEGAQARDYPVDMAEQQREHREGPGG